MILITAAELLDNTALFALFSHDSDDPAWSPELAAEWCRRFPDSLLSYDGESWETAWAVQEPR